MSEFQVFYPGEYTDREKPLVAQFVAENKAIADRGPVDVKALINGTLPDGTPGIGTVFVADDEVVMYNNRKYDPENPLLVDAEYAKKAGYEGILAYPTLAAHDDSFLKPYPHGTRDIMLVDGLNHSISFHNPIYIGDKLHLVVDEWNFMDITPPEGSVYRSIAIEDKGSVYNQSGEKVCSVIFRATENLKAYLPGQKPEEFAPWESPDWWKREDHTYTNDDWAFIRKVWASEKRQGSTPLYWEDVQIGDEPTWTLDGPIDDTAEPTYPYGTGTGGTRTLKKEIMDPELFKGLVRNPVDGIYRFPSRRASFPTIPEHAKQAPPPDAPPVPEVNDDAMCEPPHRFILINFMGRDYAIRHINNWIGDHGWICNIRWGIMPPEALRNYGYEVPQNPDAVRFLDVVPHMKGKCVHHGMERDIALVKSYVYDKFTKNGEYFVELAWWIETITGDVYEEGQATVRLPSETGGLA